VASDLFAQEINEWRPSNFQTMWYARLWVVFLLCAAAWRGPTISWRWRLLCTFFLWEALGHLRHLSLAVLLLTPFVALTLRELLKFLPQTKRHVKSPQELPTSPWSGPLAIVALLVIMLATISASSPGTGMQRRLAAHFRLPDAYSTPAMDFLEQNGYPGNYLFNEYSWGDYLLYALDEPPKVFIDGRADMYGEKILADYLSIARLTSTTNDLLKTYQIDWVLFPLNHPFIRYLKQNPDWKTLYQDDQVAIMSKAKNDRS
jgi:hypothetical protein